MGYLATYYAGSPKRQLVKVSKDSQGLQNVGTLAGLFVISTYNAEKEGIQATPPTLGKPE